MKAKCAPKFGYTIHGYGTLNGKLSGYAGSMVDSLNKLRVDRSRVIAPYKPLLLLVVLELVENGDEDARDQKSLRDLHGLRIALPSKAKLWPDPQQLAWHR